ATNADTFGGALEARNTAQLFGHDNHLVVGASLDRGIVRFDASSELGTIGRDLFVTGTGVIIAQPEGDIAPVSLRTANTYTGLFELGGGRLTWNLGAFRTDSNDDIINVASEVTGRGFFQNAGTTRRQGFEAAGAYQSDRWRVHLSYSHIDATFRDALTLSSPH